MYSDLIQIFSIILSLVAIILVFCVIIVNIYVKIRRALPTSVNCWFCNTWTKVPFDNRNSFDCPTCSQYNGFTKDGSYNKVIEAQHEVSSSKNTSPFKYSKVKSNGFCDSCNHNQQLKITQIANFTPLKEDNYDVEIEHFKNQLEKAYQLCKQCARILKSTLLKEKASIFGNHVYNIQKKGNNLFFNKNVTSISTDSLFIKLLKNVQGTLAFFIVLYVILRTTLNNNDNYINQRILESLPNSILPYFELFQDLSIFFSNVFSCLIGSIGDYFSINNNKRVGGFQYATSLGLIFQTFLFLIETSLMTIKVNQLLCWGFLTLTSWAAQEMLIYTSLFQIFCASIIFYNSFIEDDQILKVNKSFRKLSRSSINNEENEYSDDDLDISSNSATSYNSFLSNNFFDKSMKNSSFNRSSTTNLDCNKTDNYKFIANKQLLDSSRTSTASNSNSNFTNSYTKIRTCLEDLHLDSPISNNTSNYDPILRSQSILSRPLSTSPSPSSCIGGDERSKLILSPSKLNKTVTQNSWVAGGFWRNEDGTFVPLNNEEITLSRSSSQSSGFGSQSNEIIGLNNNNNNNNNFRNSFNSLPTSRKTSLCCDIDRFSLASEPAYHFHPVSPQPVNVFRNNFFNNGNPSLLNKNNGFATFLHQPQFNKTFGNVHKSSNQNFNEFVLPPVNRLNNTGPLPLYNPNKTLGLFKLPQVSQNSNFSSFPTTINGFNTNNNMNNLYNGGNFL